MEVRVPARAGLAGNPSDGYGGAVLATPVSAFGATVRVRAGTPGLHVDTDLGDEGARLVEAAVARVAALAPSPPTRPASLSVTTTIPRSVGLAGSSSIVIATIEALAAWWSIELDADTIAATALATEVEDLGIAAGLQDRICQSRRRTVFMDFSERDGFPTVQVISPPRPVPAFVAWTDAASAPSGAVHGHLRQRFDAGDEDVHAAVTALARAGRDAAGALAHGDIDALGRAMDASLRARESMVDLGSAMRGLVAAARAFTPAVNSAGSGGAVVGLLLSGADGADVARWAATHAVEAALFDIS